MRISTRWVVVLTTSSLLLAACGGGYGDDDTQGVDDGGVAGATGTTATTGATGGTGIGEATAATGAGGATADVHVSVNNYLFDPDPVEVASGDVVEVRNDNTKTPHTFTVVGEDVDLELGPQETETVTIALKPGTYELICRFHETLPMTGTLVVT